MKKIDNPFYVLKMEYEGIKNIINDYTDQGFISNYLKKMDNALTSDSFSEIIYLLDKICLWYKENIVQIRRNEYVTNFDEHLKAQAILNSLNNELKDFDFSGLLERKKPTETNGNKVFIVHGHNNETKIEVAQMLQKLGLEGIILHEQADEGKTIIEKLEAYTEDVAFAIVIYTECDRGRAKELDESHNKYRARQNVVFEHGLFSGILGRKRVCALVKGKIEKPGDIDGIIYIDMDDAGAWKLQLCRNMKAVGINVDINNLL